MRHRRHMACNLASTVGAIHLALAGRHSPLKLMQADCISDILIPGPYIPFTEDALTSRLQCLISGCGHDVAWCVRRANVVTEDLDRMGVKRRRGGAVAQAGQER